MYADFFGFRELPFNSTPDPRFFFSTPDHEEALASLIYAVKERKGCVLLTGEVGAGKTLMTRMMLRHFGTNLAFANVNHAVQSPEDLMESICTEFELPIKPKASTTHLVRVFHDFVLAQFAQDIPVVLILDEAQNLPVERFEQLRMIGNLEADDAKLLQVAIVGQPELQRMFLWPELCQLRQRIFRSFHLSALSREATERYIRHRLSLVADDGAEIFEKDATEAIYSFSNGLPRVINTLCDNALLSAYSADRRTITGPFIESVLTQMMIVGAPQPAGMPASGRPKAKPLLSVSSSRLPHPPAPEGVSQRDDETAHARLRAETLLLRMENMAQRVESVEAFLREDSSTRKAIERADTATERAEAVAGRVQANAERAEAGADRAHAYAERVEAVAEQAEATVARAEAAAGREEVTETLRAELSKLGQATDARIEKACRRIRGLEDRLDKTVGDLTEARLLRTTLAASIERSRSVLVRSETVSRELKQRDEELQRLAGTINGLVHEMRRLLERAHGAAAETAEAENRAQAIHGRLVSQSHRSCKLADKLADVVNRTMLHRQPPPRALARAVARAHQTGTASEVLTPARPPGGSPELTDVDRVHQMMQCTRESLSSLRYIARRPNNRETTQCDRGTSLRTDRLAIQRKVAIQTRPDSVDVDS